MRAPDTSGGLLHALISVLLLALLFALLLVFDVKTMAAEDTLHEVLAGLYGAMSIFVSLETLWVLFNLTGKRFLDKIMYLFSIMALTFGLVICAAAIFYLHDLPSFAGGGVAATPMEALHYATAVFIGSGLSGLQPPPSVFAFVTGTALAGYLLVPIFVSVVFSILSDKKA